MRAGQRKSWESVGEDALVFKLRGTGRGRLLGILYNAFRTKHHLVEDLRLALCTGVEDASSRGQRVS